MHFYLSFALLALSGCVTHQHKCLCFSAPHNQNLSDKALDEKSPEDKQKIKDPRDPLESFNRAMYSFNSTLDRTIFLPFIGFYRVMPLCVKNRITSLMDTVETPISMANCLFQGKGHDFLAHTARLFFNLTFGLCGLFDFASILKIQPQRQDFGKTLQKVLRVPPGPFLVIPLLGPASFRDAIGQAVDCFLLPTTYYGKTAVVYYPASYLITQAKITSIQYDLGETFDDDYAALRNAYLISRDDAEAALSTDKSPDSTVDAPPDLLGDDAEAALSTDKSPDSAVDAPPDLLGDDAEAALSTDKSPVSAVDAPPDLLG